MSPGMKPVPTTELEPEPATNPTLEPTSTMEPESETGSGHNICPKTGSYCQISLSIIAYLSDHSRARSRASRLMTSPRPVSLLALSWPCVPSALPWSIIPVAPPGYSFPPSPPLSSLPLASPQSVKPPAPPRPRKDFQAFSVALDSCPLGLWSRSPPLLPLSVGPQAEPL